MDTPKEVMLGAEAPRGGGNLNRRSRDIFVRPEGLTRRSVLRYG